MKATDIIQGLEELIRGLKQNQQSTRFDPRPNKTQFKPVELNPIGVVDAEGHIDVARVDPELAPGQAEIEMDVVEPGADTDMQKYVPPLQAKIELLKKATGVASTYDESGEQDELAQMKKMAGIKSPHPVVQDMAGEDEPLDV